MIEKEESNKHVRKIWIKMKQIFMDKCKIWIKITESQFTLEFTTVIAVYCYALDRENC